MRKKRPSVGSLSMQNYPNKSAGTVFINPAPPVPAPPVNIEAPLLSGTGAVESTVTCSSGVWTGSPTPTYTYIFYVDGIEEQNSSSNEFFVHESYDGLTITAEVTATNTEGSATEPASNSIVVGTIPVNTVEPTLSPSGIQSTGTLITINERTWDGTPPLTFEYRWLRDGIVIDGEDEKTYTIAVEDDGTVITAEVRASNAYGVSIWVLTSNQVDAVNAIAPVNTVAPVVSGTAVVGQTLSSTTGTWTGIPTPTYSYQWYRGATLISGATNSTYTLVQADAGNTSNIKCVVTATNSAGSASADSNTVAQIFDATWWDFRQTLGITDTTINNAMNTYTITRKSISTTASLGAYPFVGGTDVTHSRNLYNAADTDAAKRIVWSGTITHNANGVQGNGVNGTGDTKINSSTDFASNDFTIAWVSKTNQTRAESEMGSMGSASTGLGVEVRTTSANCVTSAQGASVNSGSGIVSDTSGVFIFKREGTTVTLRRNNVLIFTRTDGTNTKINQTINIISRRYLNVVERWSSKLYGHFEFIGIALDSTQETNLYNALAAKETALGR